MAHLKLTDALGAELAEAVAAGVPLETAAQAAGIGESTLYEWLWIAREGSRRDATPVPPDTLATLQRFAECITRAQARWEATRVRNIVTAAAAVNEKTGLVDWRAEAWLLNNHPRTRARYRQDKQVQIESHGTVSHEHSLVQGMTIEQLDALDAQLALSS